MAEPPTGKRSGAIKCYLDHDVSPCSQKGLKVFIDDLDDFIIVFDLSGRILYANPAVSRRLGYAPNEFETMSVEAVFPGLFKMEWTKQYH